MYSTLTSPSSVAPAAEFSKWLRLLRETPLLELGEMAFSQKRARYGNQVTFIFNRHINPTNLCVYSCKFCDFAAKPGASHAYALEEQQILKMVKDLEIREVHIVGGLHPVWNFSRYLNLIRAIRRARPDLWIKAFTAVEVAYFAQMERHRNVERVLKEILDASVNQLAGGGAEVLSERLHKALYPHKIGPEAWLAIHRRAHGLGLKSNATLLFGHLETDEEIVEHLLLLRNLQEETGGFQSFVPLAYQPGNTQLVPRLVSGIRCLRIIALARLVLGNIPHIKAYWPSLQVESAAAALTFGADDLDGTLGHENIMRLAGTGSPAHMTRAHLKRMADHAGQHLRERSGDFQVLSQGEGCAL